MKNMGIFPETTTRSGIKMTMKHKITNSNVVMPPRVMMK